MPRTHRWKLDCSDVLCPEPLLKTLSFFSNMKVGDSLEVVVRTPGAREDIERWAKKAGQTVVLTRDTEKGIAIFLRKES